MLITVVTFIVFYLCDICMVTKYYSFEAVPRTVQEKRAGSEGVGKLAPPKARPRPGSFNTGGPRVPRILAPPPSVQRRNSAAADLISFGSPEGSPTSQNPPRPALDEFCTPSNCQVPALTAETSSIPFSSQAHFPTSVTQFQEEIHENMTSSSSCFAQPRVQPLHVSVGGVKDSAIPVYSPVFNDRLALQSTEQVASHTDSRPNLDVLKVVGKRDNNNLIDLTPFDSLGIERMQRSVRGSVLEVFDPLLSGGQPEKKAMEETEQVAVQENRGWYKQAD